MQKILFIFTYILIGAYTVLNMLENVIEKYNILKS